MSRERHDCPDLGNLRERTDYLGSLQDHDAWEALMAEIEAKALLEALTKNAA